jgi:hypothetical protein
MLFAIGERQQHFERFEETEVCCLLDLSRGTREGSAGTQGECREAR